MRKQMCKSMLKLLELANRSETFLKIEDKNYTGITPILKYIRDWKFWRCNCIDHFYDNLLK